MAEPLTRIRIHFALPKKEKDGKKSGDKKGKDRSAKVGIGLSGVEQVDDTLFVVSDETGAIEVLRRQASGVFAGHSRQRLSALGFTIEGKAQDMAGNEVEADLEGLCHDEQDGEGWLWVIGSHAAKRGKLEGSNAAEIFAILSGKKTPPERLVFGRVPLVPGTEGPVPTTRDGKRRAAFLPVKADSSDLYHALKKDPVVGPFCGVPAKENGLDIEGLAVRGEVAFLGLRGPVVRDQAVIVGLRLALDPGGGFKLRLPLRRHLLDLDGLGVRDLTPDGDHLLVLAGPTMALDGPTYLYRWWDAFATTDEGLVAPGRLERLFEVPHGHRADHAEGICLFERPARPRRLLVVYDSPPTSRIFEDDAYYEADLFALPE
jgi:hypothetical protein